MSARVLSIKRRRSKDSSTKQVIVSERDVLEQAIDGANFKVTGKDFTLPKSRSVTFDLTANRLLKGLSERHEEPNTTLCRVALIALRELDSQVITTAFSATKTTKGMAARRDLTPLEVKEAENFPANRTLGMTPFDNMLISELSERLGKDVSHMYRAGLTLVNGLTTTEYSAFALEVPRTKRGAPKRNIDSSV